MADARINQHDARRYWQGIDADNGGMLGGYGYISGIDLRGSRNFVQRLDLSFNGAKLSRAVDCGAGIGRITKGLLLDIATAVDIVEPIDKFSNAIKGTPGIDEIFNCGLEDWLPTHNYNLIWNQWCLGYLNDAQLLAHLKKCVRVLEPDGLIIVKENISTSQADVFDDIDSSVTRTDKKFLEIFDQSGLKIKRAEIQNGFPKGLYPVKMYALLPKV
ncbi:Alpha N-terminal protein methyltransferase 1 [Erysiphe neolycopersici]|uniref:Alpha N-terminal protein methyltransferase 1 n=1 Tax=Erysiphe neolycopersici TaxID=212602 RepID=A0A420I2B6_9PEZI|nr:Alpha N-terminal protein methyltransferase 1 [Erysiphe neolycopersici]